MSSTLADVADINPTLPAKPGESDLVSFVGMSDLDAQLATTPNVQHRPFEEVSKGYTPLANGDLLVAKITPCFQNGKIGQATFTTDYGAGSTEFHVLRPKPGVIDDRYLLHFLRQPWIRIAGEKRMTGSGGQRRVPVAFLANVNVPLPPLVEQRRIAEILDRADALRAKRRQAIAKLDSLTQSIFIDMFGDLTRNDRNWSTESIETVCELVVDCVNRTAPVTGTMTPFRMIRTSNVRGGEIRLDGARTVTEEVFHRWNRRATPVDGDVILTREAPVGEVGLLLGQGSVILGQRLMLYRADRRSLNPYFLLSSFQDRFLQNQFERHGSGSTVKHLPLPACRDFRLRIPPIELQNEFELRAARAHGLRGRQRTALGALDALFASLQHRAFSGQL